LPQKTIRVAWAQSLRLKHRTLFVHGQTIQLQDNRLFAPLKIGTKRSQVALAQPIGDPARNPDLARSGREELLDQGVDRVTVAAAGAFLIQPVNEQSTVKLRCRCYEKCPRGDVMTTGAGRAFTKRMRLPRPGIAQQNDVRRIVIGRERPRRVLLGFGWRRFNSANGAIHGMHIGYLSRIRIRVRACGSSAFSKTRPTLS
jgi:hypothetical protein